MQCKGQGYTMLNHRQAIPECRRFVNQCPQLGTLKTHAPLVPQGQCDVAASGGVRLCLSLGAATR